jgi:anti-anti-sigma factor
VVHFINRHILDEAAVREVGLELIKLVRDRGQSKLLMDFQAVEHLCSAGFGMLLLLRRQVTAVGGRIALANLHPVVAEVLTITRLDQQFAVYDDVPKALASFTPGTNGPPAT